MKKIIFTLLISLSICLPAYTQDKPVKEEVKIFDMVGFHGLPWGSKKKIIEKFKITKDSKNTWISDSEMLSEFEYEEKPILLLFTMYKDRLISVTHQGIDESGSTKVCKDQTKALINIIGYPNVGNEIILQWSNENTTLQLFCNKSGPVLNYYMTLWLSYRQGMTPQNNIPVEAIERARKKILKRNKNTK